METIYCHLCKEKIENNPIEIIQAAVKRSLPFRKPDHQLFAHEKCIDDRVLELGLSIFSVFFEVPDYEFKNNK